MDGRPNITSAQGALKRRGPDSGPLRLGEQYEIGIETVSKPRGLYHTDEHFELDLPVAPAVMVGGEILVEDAGVDEHELEAAICRRLDLPEPGPPAKRSFLNKLLK